jgi:chemotaxis protein MotB
MILEDAHEAEVDEENYFVSMTDMMVGLVFIFIIMLMYFALQFQVVTDQMTGADVERAKILKALQQTLKSKGVEVTIDTQNGILRLPDAILFDSGKAELKPEGKIAVGHLAEALADVLPCYTDRRSGGNALSTTCRASAYRIESVYIEGHTDIIPFAGAFGMRDNLDLSATRATNTFREIIQDKQEIAESCSTKAGSCEAVLSVSGYGSARPIDNGISDEARRRNRRIDLRLVMVNQNAQAAIQAVSQQVSGR